MVSLATAATISTSQDDLLVQSMLKGLATISSTDLLQENLETMQPDDGSQQQLDETESASVSTEFVSVQESDSKLEISATPEIQEDESEQDLQEHEIIAKLFLGHKMSGVVSNMSDVMVRFRFPRVILSPMCDFLRGIKRTLYAFI